MNARKRLYLNIPIRIEVYSFERSSERRSLDAHIQPKTREISNEASDCHFRCRVGWYHRSEHERIRVEYSLREALRPQGQRDGNLFLHRSQGLLRGNGQNARHAIPRPRDVLHRPRS